MSERGSSWLRPSPAVMELAEQEALVLVGADLVAARAPDGAGRQADRIAGAVVRRQRELGLLGRWPWSAWWLRRRVRALLQGTGRDADALRLLASMGTAVGAHLELHDARRTAAVSRKETP